MQSRSGIVLWLLTRNVQIPQQTLFARQDIYTGEEPLQSLEVSIAFRCDQFLFPFLPCVIPLLRDPSRALGCVLYADVAKLRSLHEPFILSGRAVHVKADRATRSDLFVGNRSANDQSVTEQHPSTGLEYAKHLNQHLGASWKMAQNVILE